MCENAENCFAYLGGLTVGFCAHVLQLASVRSVCYYILKLSETIINIQPSPWLQPRPDGDHPVALLICWVHCEDKSLFRHVSLCSAKAVENAAGRSIDFSGLSKQCCCCCWAALFKRASYPFCLRKTQFFRGGWKALENFNLHHSAINRSRSNKHDFFFLQNIDW